MGIGDNTVAAVDTGGNDVNFSDIQQWCTQDPVTNLWSLTPPNTPSDVASWINADFRHQTDTTFGAVWSLVVDTLDMQFRLNGQVEWIGMFPDYHNQLSNTGQRNKLLKQAFQKMINKGQGSPAVIPCSTNEPVSNTQVDNLNQRSGLVIAEWNEVCQDIADGVYDADPNFPTRPYDPDGLSPYKGDPQAVYDLWQLLTGGRRFGAVQDTDITALINTENDDQKSFNLSQRQTNAHALAVERQTTSMDEATLQATWNQAWTDATA